MVRRIQAKKQVKTPSWRWRDRFYRTKPFGDKCLYVSRPTFEQLRAKKEHYVAISSLLDSMNNRELKSDEKFAKFSSLKDKEDLEIYVFWNDKNGPLSIIFGPFGVEQEMEQVTNAYLVHTVSNEKIGKDGWKKHLNDDSQLFSGSEAFTMFLNNENSPFRRLMGSEINPNEIEKILFKEDHHIIHPSITDLTSARLLPAEPIIEFAQQETSWPAFQRMINLQYLEVRISNYHFDMSYEQSRAIDRYSFKDSTMLNGTGRPGVGKSTILHMLICEALLQTGPLRGNRRCLYLATTRNLIQEAKHEVRSLLKYVYGLSESSEITKAMDLLDFVTEEDLIGPITPFDGLLSNRGDLKEILFDNDYVDPLTFGNYWLDRNHLEDRVDEIQHILKNFVYGVFGSPSKFCSWVPTGRDDNEIKDKFTSPMNLISPESLIVGDYESDMRPVYFWNPGFSYDGYDSEINSKEAANRVRDFAKLLEHSGGLKDYLIDPAIGKFDGLWDPSAAISGVHDSLEDVSISSNEDEFVERYGKYWHSAILEGYDAIFVDESQDFSVQVLSTLLKSFSKRSPKKSNSLSPFTFVCMGDEFQTIRGSLYQGQMLHINKIYTDWFNVLDSYESNNNVPLSDELSKPNKFVLVANYRNSRPTVKSMTKVINAMNELGKEKGNKRAVRLKDDGEFKDGVRSLIPNEEGSSLQQDEDWNTILTAIEKQLKSFKSNDAVTVKVGIIHGEDKISNSDSLKKLINHFNSLGKTSYVERFIAHLEAVNEEISARISEGISKREEENEFAFYLQEIGIFDIESVKGLTLPCAVCLFPKTNFEYSTSWEKKMQDLAKSLVMISRPQYGLFVVSDSKNFELINTSNTTHEEDFKHDSSINEYLDLSMGQLITLDDLFKKCLSNWSNRKIWDKASNKVTEYGYNDDVKDFIDWMKDLHGYLQVIESEYENFNRLINDARLTEGTFREEIESALGASEFLEPRNLANVSLYSKFNHLSRRILQDEGDMNIIDLLDEIFQEIEGLSNHGIISSRSKEWIDVLRSGQILDSRIKQDFDNSPISRKKISPFTVPYLPTKTETPKFNFSPWKFNRPSEYDYNGPWMQTGSIWTMPRKVLKKLVTTKFDSNDSNNLSWLIDCISNDCSWIIENCSSGKSLNAEEKLNLLRWVLLVANSDEGMYFSSLLRYRIDLNSLSDELNAILLQSDTFNEFRKWIEIIESISKSNGLKNVFSVVNADKNFRMLWKMKDVGFSMNDGDHSFLERIISNLKIAQSEISLVYSTGRRISKCKKITENAIDPDQSKLALELGRDRGNSKKSYFDGLKIYANMTDNVKHATDFMQEDLKTEFLSLLENNKINQLLNALLNNISSIKSALSSNFDDAHSIVSLYGLHKGKQSQKNYVYPAFTTGFRQYIEFLRTNVVSYDESDYRIRLFNLYSGGNWPESNSFLVDGHLSANNENYISSFEDDQKVLNRFSNHETLNRISNNHETYMGYYKLQVGKSSNEALAGVKNHFKRGGAITELSSLIMLEGLQDGFNLNKVVSTLLEIERNEFDVFLCHLNNRFETFTIDDLEDIIPRTFADYLRKNETFRKYSDMYEDGSLEEISVNQGIVKDELTEFFDKVNRYLLRIHILESLEKISSTIESEQVENTEEWLRVPLKSIEESELDLMILDNVWSLSIVGVGNRAYPRGAYRYQYAKGENSVFSKVSVQPYMGTENFSDIIEKIKRVLEFDRDKLNLEISRLYETNVPMYLDTTSTEITMSNEEATSRYFELLPKEKRGELNQEETKEFEALEKFLTSK